MTTNNIDLNNTDFLKCEAIGSDGVSASPCAEKEYDDVLYIPQNASWYLISKEYAENLKDVANQLDESIKPLIDALYGGKANANETQEVRESVLKNLNNKGVLESYKTLSHAFFLNSVEDKKTYAQAIYARELLKTYVSLLSSSSKRPRFELIKEDFDQGLQHYSVQLGLTEADLADGAPANQAIKTIQRFVTIADTTRIGHATKSDLVRFINNHVIDSIEENVKKLEKKAQKASKEQGYSWYKSQSSQEFRFVKNEEVRLEKLYKNYLKLVPHFHKQYINELTIGSMQEEFAKHQKGKSTNIIANNMFNVFYQLNRRGVALPEQTLGKSELFSETDEAQKEFERIHNGFGFEELGELISKGDTFKSLSLEQLHYDSEIAEPKPLSALVQSPDVKFIETIGYFNLVSLSQALDENLASYIKQFVEEILGGSASSDGYADGGLYYLMALRYQISYLKHKAKVNLEAEQIHFCKLNTPQFSKTALLPLDDISWISQDIQLTQYEFAWKENNSHIVEFFLLSEKNKPRYMLSDELNRVSDYFSRGLVTRLDLNEQVDVPSADVDTNELKQLPSKQLKSRLSSAIADAQAAAKNNSSSNVSLNSTLSELDMDNFTQYTSLIQLSYTEGGGEGLNYTVNAQAELLRFCSDSLRFESDYPTSFDELYDKVSEKNASIASLKVGAQIDLASGFMKVHQMLPSRNGFSMMLPSVKQVASSEKSTYFHIGQLRNDCDLTFYGSVGIGFSLASSVNLSSIDAGVLLQPIIPAETTINLPSGGSVQGEVDLFAGARMGQAVSSQIKWCKPNEQATAKNWIASLSEEQRKALLSTTKYSERTDTNWKPLGRLARAQELRFGIGIRGVFQFGYVNKQYVIKVGGGFTYGVGGALDYTIALYPESLLDIVNALTEILAREDFRRVEMFTEQGEDGALDGFKVLNTLITMTMVTGLDISQLALLDMTEVIEQEQNVLLHQHSDTVALRVNDFFKLNTSNESNGAWFNNIPPEARARLLYALVKEEDALTPELFERIEQVNALGRKAKPLDDKEIQQLRTGVTQEVERWVAVARLLESWSTEYMEVQKKFNRQVEETFSRFNSRGQTMLAHPYGNKIMPIVVWEKLKGFLKRMDKARLHNEDLLGDNGYGNDDMSRDNIRFVTSLIDKFDSYFSAYNKYEQKNYQVKGQQSAYYIYNEISKQENQTVSAQLLDEAKRFGYYHLARKEIFPQDYADESMLFSNPKQWFSDRIDEAKQEVNELIEELTGIDDGLGKINNLNEIQQAASSGDYPRLFELLGEMS
ncbi:hypothetical protein L1D09_12430 [Vibrio tubiashii]|uniref:hypothetical protein n=1 Tax=Vibrio tubiashii TaxID=29498 RepID=UPI001EFEDA05|nr:hypothetical protein [Vibrio tubiashii]MCG9582336.1 hypothetical protein [Vibrio tubiashii]MCG9615927.1 hypothetical protein [Vibrio tubiashii]